MRPRPKIDYGSEEFGDILISAVRYALGRRTHVVSTVVNFVIPLIPYLSDRVLLIFCRDYKEQGLMGGYGDSCDEVNWLRFYNAVLGERVKRGYGPRKPWREE